MDLPNQIVFIRGDHRFLADGSSFEKVWIRGLARPLPPGMRASYTVEVSSTGRESCSGFIQARCKHGKRYLCEGGEFATQARILKWSARILREIAKEQALKNSA